MGTQTSRDPDRAEGRSGRERGDYTLYRSRRPLLGASRERAGLAGLRAERGRRGRIFPRRPTRLGPLTPGRVLRWVLVAVVAWLALSLVLFLVSAQVAQEHVSHGTELALDGGGFPLTSDQTSLVLGSDARDRRTHEAGASVVGQPSRSDVIMLIRTGLGHNSRLSIPRDTVVDIPGHGRAKINAAYALGGAALAISTVKAYLGISVNHVIEVNFDNFPAFIDAVGGIDYSGSCVHSVISGGVRNGGQTLLLPAGTHHLNGKQALTLARTRHNQCNPAENDLTRAKRQQKILSAVKGRMLTPSTFLHLPWVAWDAPKTIKSDMGGPTLLGLAADMASAGSPQPDILHPSSFLTLPDGGQGLVVSGAEKRRAVHALLGG